MANAITPVVTRFVPAWLLKALKIITDVLLQGRVITGGAYSQGAGPALGNGGSGNFAPQGLLGIPVPKVAQKYVLKKGVEEALERVDTPEEREAIIRHLESKGVPKRVADGLNFVFTAFVMWLMTVDTNRLLDDPFTVLKAGFIFVSIKVFMYWQTPGSHVVETSVQTGPVEVTQAVETTVEVKQESKE